MTERSGVNRSDLLSELFSKKVPTFVIRSDDNTNMKTQYQVTKKISHDRLWVKVKQGDCYGRLGLSRSGARCTGKGTRVIAKKIWELYRQCMDAEMTYGDTIDYIALEFQS